MTRGIALALVVLLATACAPANPASPTPTAAPAAKPTTPPTTAPAATSAAAPAANPTTPPAVAYDEKAVADFYQGKTVRIIVGVAAGGGYDTYARMIARYFGQYIPGKPTVVVENQPGAGSVLAMKQIFNTAPKDGTVIGSVVAQNVAAEQLYGQSVDFDLTKVGHIGAPSADKFAFYLAKRTGVTKLDDVIGANAQPIVIGTVAPAGDPGSAMSAYLNTFFGAKIKNVSGYAGTAPIRLAIDSGEVDGYVNAWQSHVVTSKEKTDSGEWLILLQWTLEPIAGVPSGVPTVKDIARTPEQLQLGRLAILPNDFARPLFLPPGAPPDRLAALQAAFAQTMADPDFKAEAAKANLEINPQTPEQLLSSMKEFFAAAESVKAQLKPIIAP